MKYISFIPWVIFPFIMFFLVVLIPSKPFSDPLWEIVPTPNSSAHIMRTPVPHGWMVAYKSYARGMVYIPDEKHEWKIK